MHVLVTGGAGYIGSHTVHQLLDAGYDVTVLDNLQTGHRWAVPGGAEFVYGNVGDQELVARIFMRNQTTAVLHFAASTVVPESVQDPLKYYRNNLLNSFFLIEACIQHGIKHFIFSSTAAVYGKADHECVTEETEQRPVSPYGMSKFASERVLQDAAIAHQSLTYVILRYFNVAGAQLNPTTGAPTLKLGQATPAATHLIKVAAETACHKRRLIEVFGTDYATRDGTGVRDYIHVDDLAAAHVQALAYLRQGGQSDCFNCGYGRGYSVREVLAAMRRVSGNDIPITERSRRPGDIAALIADNTKISQRLRWQPRFNDLDLICRSAYEWERSSAGGNQAVH